MMALRFKTRQFYKELHYFSKENAVKNNTNIFEKY